MFLQDLVLPRTSVLKILENDGTINLLLQDDRILFTKFMIVELVWNYLRGLTAFIVKVSAVWNVTPCILVDNYRCQIAHTWDATCGAIPEGWRQNMGHTNWRRSTQPICIISVWTCLKL